MWCRGRAAEVSPGHSYYTSPGMRLLRPCHTPQAPAGQGCPPPGWRTWSGSWTTGPWMIESQGNENNTSLLMFEELNLCFYLGLSNKMPWNSYKLGELKHGMTGITSSTGHSVFIYVSERHNKVKLIKYIIYNFSQSKNPRFPSQSACWMVSYSSSNTVNLVFILLERKIG